MNQLRVIIFLAAFCLLVAPFSGCKSSSKSSSSNYPGSTTGPVDDDDDDNDDNDDTSAIDADADGYDENDDCDDNNAEINPGATEIPYDDIDQDCDGDDLTDVDGDGTDSTEADGTDCDDNDDTVWQAVEAYADVDLDGFGAGDAVELCIGDDLPIAYADAATDCNDAADDQNPLGVETAYDGVDQDCDGFDVCDVDGDGYYSATITDASLCPLGELPGDCNDNDSGIHPSLTEIAYDGIDQDCDGLDLCDNDGDGFFPDSEVVNDYLCGDSLFPGDCDDNQASVNPAADEVCGNGFDDNCDDTQCSEPPVSFCPNLEIYPTNGGSEVAINEIVSAVCIDDYFPADTTIMVQDGNGLEVPGRIQFYNCDSADNQICGGWHFQPDQMLNPDTVYSVSIDFAGEKSGTWFATGAADSSAAQYAPMPDNRFTSTPLAFLVEHTKINKPDGMVFLIDNEMLDLLTWFNEASSWIISPAGFPGMNASYSESAVMLASGQALELESSNDGPELDHSSIGYLFLSDLRYDNIENVSKIEALTDPDEVTTMEIFYGLPVEVKGYGTEASFGDIPESGEGLDLINGRSTATILNCYQTCIALTAIYSAEYPGIDQLCQPTISYSLPPFGTITETNPAYICNPDDTMDYDMEWVGYNNPVSAVAIAAPEFVSAPVDGVVLEFVGARWDSNNPAAYLAEETITLLIHPPDGASEPLRSTSYVDSVDFLSYDCPTGEIYCNVKSAFFNLPADFRTAFDIPAGSYCDVEVIVGLQYSFFKKVRF